MDLAVYYSAHVIVMEKLDLKGRKHGSKKQRLHRNAARNRGKIWILEGASQFPPNDRYDVIRERCIVEPRGIH